MPGIITTTPAQPERDGLGDVAVRWPNLRIMKEGPQIVLEPDHSRAIVPFKVAWDDRFRLAAELLGWPYIDTVNGFRRNLPESFQGWEWILATFGQDPATYVPIPSLYCTRILSMKGIGDGAQDTDRTGTIYYPEPTYEWAEVVAFFETLAYEVALWDNIIATSDRTKEMQRYVLRTEDSGGKYLTFQWGQWVLYNPAATPTTSKPLANQMSFYESYQTVKYEWYDVLPTAYNHARAQKYRGKGNSIIFDGYQPETLLLLKANRTPTKTQLGQRTYRVTFEFLYVPSGINRALPPTQEMQVVNGTNPDGSPIQPYWDIRSATDITKKPYLLVPMVDLFTA